MQLRCRRDVSIEYAKIKQEFEMSIKKLGVAAVATLAILGASLTASAPASARGFGGGFHGGGYHGGGFGGRGFGIGAGIATGLAFGAYGYGYGYGYPAYAYNGYGGDCFIQNRVVYRYGHRVFVPVQVCGY
jgi:hypothetical protein